MYVGISTHTPTVVLYDCVGLTYEFTLCTCVCVCMPLSAAAYENVFVMSLSSAIEIAARSKDFCLYFVVGLLVRHCGRQFVAKESQQ